MPVCRSPASVAPPRSRPCARSRVAFDSSSPTSARWLRSRSSARTSTPATRAQIDRGQRLTEILKQGQYQPMPVEEQVAVIWTATNGYLDDVPVERVREFEAGLA